MKKIEAIIRSSKFEAVKESLAKEGIYFFTFYEVKGFGHQKGIIISRIIISISIDPIMLCWVFRYSKVWYDSTIAV